MHRIDIVIVNMSVCHVAQYGTAWRVSWFSFSLFFFFPSSNSNLHPGDESLGWHCCFRQFLFTVSARLMRPPTTYLYTREINEEDVANEITSTRWRNRLIWRILPVIWQYLEASPAPDSHFLPVIFNQRFLPKIKVGLCCDHDQRNIGVAGLHANFILTLGVLSSSFFAIQHQQLIWEHQYLGLKTQMVIYSN